MTGLAQGRICRLIGNAEPTPMARAAEWHALAVCLGCLSSYLGPERAGARNRPALQPLVVGERAAGEAADNERVVAVPRRDAVRERRELRCLDARARRRPKCVLSGREEPP